MYECTSLLTFFGLLKPPFHLLVHFFDPLDYSLYDYFICVDRYLLVHIMEYYKYFDIHSVHTCENKRLYKISLFNEKVTKKFKFLVFYLFRKFNALLEHRIFSTYTPLVQIRNSCWIIFNEKSWFVYFFTCFTHEQTSNDTIYSAIIKPILVLLLANIPRQFDPFGLY